MLIQAYTRIIQFDYKVRVDTNRIFEDGNSLVNKYLLSKIIVSSEAEPFKMYDFSYGLFQDISILKSINEYTDTNKNNGLNETRFKYGNSPDSFMKRERFYHPDLSATQNIIHAAGFNGDGKSDLLVEERTQDAAVNWTYTSSLKVLMNTPSGFVVTTTIPVPSGKYIKHEERGLLPPHLQGSYYGDFNHDGFEDIVVSYASNPPTTGSSYRLMDSVVIFYMNAN
jgi:hypothetical protein